MKRLTLKGVLIPTVCLFVICLVVTALLAGTNLLTKDTIAQQTLLKEQNSRKEVLPAAETFDGVDADGDGTADYYQGLDASGRTAGYVFITESKGYGGAIKVMTGITSDAQVSGVVLLEQEETPGLGANAAQESFREQYVGPAPEDGFTVLKNGGASADNEVDALTGATISSKAVTEAVNQALTVFWEIQAKGGAN